MVHFRARPATLHCASCQSSSLLLAPSSKETSASGGHCYRHQLRGPYLNRAGLPRQPQLMRPGWHQPNGRPEAMVWASGRGQPDQTEKPGEKEAIT